MDRLSWLNVAGFLLVFAPLLTLVHELGHAAVPLARTDGFVVVQVGRDPGRWRVRLGRLILRVDPLPSLGSVAGYARAAGRLSPAERATFAVAGPAASALFSLLLVAVGRRGGSYAFELYGWIGFGISVFCLVPRRVGRLRSDGWHLLEALAGNGTSQSDRQDTAARVEVMLTRSATHLTEHRRRVLGGVPVVLGLPNERSEEAFALCRIAFVGWCWRESEREPRDVREAALDALLEATRTGAVEPSLTGFAAQLLAQSEADFGAAFEEGCAFACRADAGTPARFAFRFGGALHEIERIRR